MKTLETKQEIAIAINMHEMPVVRIDLADADEYGIKSQKALLAQERRRIAKYNQKTADALRVVELEARP